MLIAAVAGLEASLLYVKNLCYTRVELLLQKPKDR